MSQQHFAGRLTAAVSEKQTPLVVGIDPRIENLPEPLRKNLPDVPQTAADFQSVAEAYVIFGLEIIDVVSPLVAAIKPQAAFFEQLGTAGIGALQKITTYARSKGLIVIMDAKRGDIGSTATAYAKAYLGERSPFVADCLTVNPYMGADTLEPFTDRAKETGTGLFVLVKTSNPGSDSFQGATIENSPGKTLFSLVADHVETLASADAHECGYGFVGAVVGATYPEQLVQLRASMPHTIFLVPGVGAQGATAADVAGAFDSQGHGALINSSRAIIFAWQRPEFESAKDWQQATELATCATIEQIAADTPAGNLRGPK